MSGKPDYTPVPNLGERQKYFKGTNVRLKENSKWPSQHKGVWLQVVRADYNTRTKLWKYTLARLLPNGGSVVISGVVASEMEVR